MAWNSSSTKDIHFGNGKSIKRTDVDFAEGLHYSDITRGYCWDRSDYDFIKRKYELIKYYDKRREYGSKRKLIEQLEDSLDRFMNDQTAFDRDAQRYIEPLDITQKIDRVTNAGRTRAAELITGESGHRFDYAAVGTSRLKVFDTDYRLGAEVNRINLRESGYASASGAVIKHSAIWTPGLPSFIIWEFAPVDLPAFSIHQMIWARVVFPVDKPLPHAVNEDFFSITHSAYTSSLV